MYSPGQRVRIREREWQIEDVQEHERPGGGAVETLTVSGLAGDVQGERTTFYWPVEDVEVVEPAPLSFRLDGSELEWQRFHDAILLSMAQGRSTLSSLGMGRVRVEDYQLVPVLAALRLPRPRLLIADDVGLGKTVEAGLILLELLARGRANRVLVVTPAALQQQWQDELLDKFGLQFTRFDSTTIARVRQTLVRGANPWRYHNRIITSIDYLKRPDVRRSLRDVPWQLIIVDEAHYLSEAGGPGDLRRTQRSRLGEFLAEEGDDGLLLLTATPHNGYTEGFASLLRLCQPLAVPPGQPIDQSRVEPFVVRRLKSDIIKNGKPMYRPPEVARIEVHLSEAERRLYQEVDRYAKRVWRRSKASSDRAAAGFAMTVLKKRLLSSHRAIQRSLRTRLDTISGESVDVRARQSLVGDYLRGVPLTESQEERVQETLLAAGEGASAADLAREKSELERLIRLADRLQPEQDSKAQALLAFLNGRFAADPGDKVIVFSEFRDTVDALEVFLNEHGYGERLVVIHGELDRVQRIQREQAFARPEIRLLLATDAASEGINLQEHCHTVVHNELPWNPNRLEQRNGRVDRYGQTKVVEVRNLWVADSLDDRILEVLHQKLARIRRELGSVANVVGVPLDVETHLMEGGGLAKRQGDELGEDDATSRRVQQAVADTIDEARARAADRPEAALLLGSAEDASQRPDVRQAKREASRFLPEPGELEGFVLDSLKRAGAEARPLREGVYAIRVPEAFRRNDVEPEYPLATFRHDIATAEGNREIAYLTPRHPLVRAVLQATCALLHDPSFGHRVAHRVVAPGSCPPGLLVTASVRLHEPSGMLIEERFLPVFVGLDGVVSHDPEADFARFKLPSERRNVRPDYLEMEVEPIFDDLLGIALIEARQRAGLAAAALAGEQHDLVQRLLADLEFWAGGQRQHLKEQILKLGEERGAQLSLGLTDASEAEQRRALLRARQARLSNELDRRDLRVRDQCEQILSRDGAAPGPIEPLGALILVPADVGGR